MTFSELLKEKGFTAQSLSEKSGISRRTIEQYTAGYRSLANARAAIVADLADALGVTVRELVECDSRK